MGCDIHLFVEYKKDDIWRTADHWDMGDEDRLSVPSHLEYYGGRAYYLFSNLADCGRCIDNKPIVENRGFPKDARSEVKAYREFYGTDGHSDSWITFKELDQHNKLWKEENIPEEWRVCLSRLWSLSHNKQVSDENIRIVFWFDN